MLMEPGSFVDRHSKAATGNVGYRNKFHRPGTFPGGRTLGFSEGIDARPGAPAHKAGIARPAYASENGVVEPANTSDG
jgi:hypothetical protein